MRLSHVEMVKVENLAHDQLMLLQLAWHATESLAAGPQVVATADVFDCWSCYHCLDSNHSPSDLTGSEFQPQTIQRLNSSHLRCGMMN